MIPKQICAYQRDDFIVYVCFSLDGKLVASGGHDNKIKIYDIKKEQEIFTYHHDCVDCVCFSSDGNLVVSGSKDKVKVYDIKKQKGWEYNHARTSDVCFSLDGK